RLDECAGRIRVGRCPDRNLSRSRNIAIRMAAGDLVAFTDDDAYPDPAWIDQLAAGFDSDEVAATGGPVYDHTGAHPHTQYITVHRLRMGGPASAPPHPPPLLAPPPSARLLT